MSQNSIVVYRSRAEQERDEFMQEHPGAVLIFYCTIVLIAVIWLLKNKR